MQVQIQLKETGFWALQGAAGESMALGTWRGQCLFNLAPSFPALPCLWSTFAEPINYWYISVESELGRCLLGLGQKRGTSKRRKWTIVLQILQSSRLWCALLLSLVNSVQFWLHPSFEKSGAPNKGETFCDHVSDYDPQRSSSRLFPTLPASALKPSMGLFYIYFKCVLANLEAKSQPGFVHAIGTMWICSWRNARLITVFLGWVGGHLFIGQCGVQLEPGQEMH